MSNISNLLRVTTSLNNIFRAYGKHNKKFLYKRSDVQKVNGTINYYPRNKDEVDPEITPTKLFRVSRVKPVKGNPFWERRILRELGLFGRPDRNVTIVKNIPENNARLWKVKHLIEITPIHFPQGEPTMDDINHTFLKENGDCIVIKNIDSLNQRMEAAEKKDPKELDPETLKKESRLRWLNPWN